MNAGLVELIVQKLAARGVRCFCLCPGGRSAPFVELLSRAKGLEVLRFYEERSAGFFALGRTRRDNRPAAVVTTSGTAAAELLPAALEGFYSGLPLALVTADRPFSHGKKGCPQTLENQGDIFKNCAALSLNIEKEADAQAIDSWLPSQGSLHLNTAFDEPLLDRWPKAIDFSKEFFQSPPEIYPFPDIEKSSELKISRARRGEIAQANRFAGTAAPQEQVCAPPAPNRRKPQTASSPQRSAAEISWAAGGRWPTKAAGRIFKQKASVAPADSSKNTAETRAAIKNFFQRCKKPLVLAGELREEEIAPVQDFLQNWKGLFFAEPLSRLGYLPGRLLSGEKILSAAFRQKAADGVLRLGGVPRARFWRDLEKSPWPVLSLSSPPFYPGLARESLNFPLLEGLPFAQKETARLSQASLESQASARNSDRKPAPRRPDSRRSAKAGEAQNKKTAGAAASPLESFKEYDRSQWEKWREILKQYPAGEPAWIARLRESLPDRSKVFLGNSLPIRLWNMSAPPLEKTHIAAGSIVNRPIVTGQGGVNGIDGLVSRFLGECLPSYNNVAILGDLSVLYDMAGFWRAAKISPWTVAVINNFGGRIFSRLWKNPDFLNEHGLSFEGLAKMWGLSYRVFKEPSRFFWPNTAAAEKSFLLEIRPNQKETEACFEAACRLWEP